MNAVGLFKPCVYSRLPANLSVSLIASFIGPSLYAKAVGFLSLFSEFSRQPKCRFYRSVTLCEGRQLIEPCVYPRLLVILSLLSRQPNYWLSGFVTLVKAVGLFKSYIY